jgi:superfamily II DNA helicase RecQ
MDRPPFKVASDECLMRLSREQPSRLADLHLSGWQVRRFGSAILAAVARGKTAPAPQPPNRHLNREHRLDPATVARYDRLRAWRGQRAVERGVEADVVLTNEALLTIARAAPTTFGMLDGLAVMGPWKLEEYGVDVLAVLAAEVEPRR